MLQFRIDDIGASTKIYEQYGRKTFYFHHVPFFYFPLANFGFFKRLPPFRRWGKYSELTVQEWEKFLPLFKKYNIKPIIAITAAWVEADSGLTPFPKKFPQQAAFLKQAADRGEVIIANHGLTHCVVGKHLPKLFGSNRQFHREFLPSLPEATHRNHIVRSQEILENFFQKPIDILVPPGNLWSIKTARAAKGTNIRKIICSRPMADSTEKLEHIEFINDRQGFVNFHDRELKLYGEKWLEKLAEKMTKTI